MNVFFDSSVVTKRYVKEAGTERVRELFSKASSAAVSVICLAEVAAALNRLRREGNLTQAQYADRKKALFQDTKDVAIVQITDDVIARSVAVVEHWPLRAADALHIGCAAEWGADLFTSADARQCTAAEEYGLRVERLAVI